MRGLLLAASALLAPLAAVLAAPTAISITTSIESPSKTVQNRGEVAVVTPVFCQPIVPAPTEEETEARFQKFAHAFIDTKNLTEAFEYISPGYINHNPSAQNGAAAALDILGPIWDRVTITPIRRTFEGEMGWLNYRTDEFGEVVDRYRWEDGCIAEHWDQNEPYPSGGEAGEGDS
ncbi:hypothetical protein B0T17DRAFT_502185 [Bombardia bombarda]|uniref:SnoaL-like domain-containing protein n=1 Tax=Bombardia bombarda TaxID=252184 RepID=A0AA39XIZ5_9PEZI|nr:hypothetical protein B0T17DRAFT_502185 [Bombardia bombarda]